PILEVDRPAPPRHRVSQLVGGKRALARGPGLEIGLLPAGECDPGRQLTFVRFRGRQQIAALARLDSALPDSHLQGARPQIKVEFGSNSANPVAVGGYPEWTARIMSHPEKRLAPIQVDDPPAGRKVDARHAVAVELHEGAIRQSHSELCADRGLEWRGRDKPLE